MNFNETISNGYMIPTSVAVGSGEATDIRCVCDTVEDFKTFLDAKGMELRYEGLITYEKVNKLLKVYKGNNVWQTVGEGGNSVDTSSFITLTQLSQQLNSYYTKSETDEAMNDKANKVHTHNEYLTELPSHEHEQYLTEHQDISHKADKSDIYTKIQTDNKILEEIAKLKLNDIVSQIEALRSDVDKLLQNNGGEGEVEKLYYNPTITIENNRAIFREDGYEEAFMITHVENRNDPNYRGSVQVRGADGYDYYVLLTDNAESTNSKFRYNNLIPSHGGWMSLENKGNQPYQFVPDRTYPYRNGFNFTDTVENVDGSVNPQLLNIALEHLNTAFPAVNMQVATSSKNKIRQQSVQDPWWGAHYPYAEYFDIIINERPIENWVGPYGAGYFDYSDRGGWIHTVLHELGHAFGLKDQPKHDPSLFNYDASYEQLAGELFLQPNDMCALSYFYKKHYNLDITPETTQEDINNQLAQNAQVATFTNELDTCEVEDAEIFMDFMYPSFDTTDIKVEVSDVVVRCKLKFDKEEKIQITKDESNNISLRYNVFTIEPLETFKGELVNNKLKIHISENMNIDENAEYFAYLVNYEDVPCSLINPKQGLEKLS